MRRRLFIGMLGVMLGTMLGRLIYDIIALVWSFQ